jgi:rubrerythrin
MSQKIEKYLEDAFAAQSKAAVPEKCPVCGAVKGRFKEVM